MKLTRDVLFMYFASEEDTNVCLTKRTSYIKIANVQNVLRFLKSCRRIKRFDCLKHHSPVFKMAATVSVVFC